MPHKSIDQEKFAVKVVGMQVLKTEENLRSPNFGQDKVVEVNFSLVNRGNVTYLTRSLSLVKNAMTRIQRRVNSPTEQS